MVLSAVQHRAVHKSEPGGHPAAGTAAQRRLPRARADEHDGWRAREAVARGDQEAHPDAAVHGPYIFLIEIDGTRRHINHADLLRRRHLDLSLAATWMASGKRLVNVPYSLLMTVP